MEGVRIITSGGGGAPPLYAPAEQGGVHHFLLVTAQGDNVEISCQPVPTPQDQSGLLLLTGRESREFTPADLEALGTVTGESCFQNQFGNFSPPQATYRGVPLRTLVEQVGGMRPEDVLVVQSVDGYVQEFSFGNVHPEKMGWEDLQGEAILALAADEEKCRPGGKDTDWYSCRPTAHIVTRIVGRLQTRVQAGTNTLPPGGPLGTERGAIKG